ncbi:MAG: polysaccharide pyruvyl transferase family protein [Campylobacterales bacterium]|nr:polysaccharide pyruvyl transferase family protein [Campylobacterales bacterium]
MKLMMFAHGGSLNRGCEAIVRSSTSIIKENIKKVEVYLASENPKTDEIINELDGVFDASKKSISKYSPEWLISSYKLKLFNDESYALGKIENNTIKHIDKMDVFLSIGGDNYCYGEQPGWYEIDKRIKKNGKKLVLWACSIGEEDMSERKLQDLKLFDLILARESLTYEVLKNRGLKNVKLCADPAFTLKQERLALPRGWAENNTIGLNYSPLVQSRNPNSYNGVKELIHYILNTTNYTIALTPHVIYKGNDDYKLLLEFYEYFKDSGRVIILPEDLNAIQYKGYISRMKFFIGARTHATIAAYSSGVPTMVLGYSVKSKGIARDIFEGKEKYVLRIEELSDSQKLIDEFSRLVKEEEEIRNQLKQSIPLIKKRSYDAVRYLKELTVV